MPEYEGLAAIAAVNGDTEQPDPVTAPKAEAPKEDAPQAAPVAEAPVPDAESIRRAERERISAIQAIELPEAGCRDIVKAAIDNGQSPEATALEMVKHLKASGAVDVVSAMAQGAATVPAIDPVSVDAGAAEDAAPSADAPIKERAEHDWNKSADLRAEFSGNFDAYLAYQAGRENGQVRSK